MSKISKVKFNFKDLKDFRKRVEAWSESEIDTFIEACAKELAARLLRKVIKRTPVGEYDKPVSFTTAQGKEVSFTPHTGKKGGTLRHGWTAGKNQSVSAYVQNLSVRHVGDTYAIEIVNPTEYAHYVEYGHRTANHRGWVKGQFIMTIAEKEIQQATPAILEKKLKKKLEECLK